MNCRRNSESRTQLPPPHRGGDRPQADSILYFCTCPFDITLAVLRRSNPRQTCYGAEKYTCNSLARCSAVILLWTKGKHAFYFLFWSLSCHVSIHNKCNARYKLVKSWKIAFLNVELTVLAFSDLSQVYKVVLIQLQCYVQPFPMDSQHNTPSCTGFKQGMSSLRAPHSMEDLE